MRASELAAPTEKADSSKINSDVDMEKTLAEVFEQCGFGPPIENPLRHMKPGTAEWERLPADDKKKALRRYDKMFRSWEKAGERSDYDAAAQKMTDQYPICAWKDCKEIATLRCGRCDSDTEKYCSIECQGADYSRHKHKCVQDTVGAATHASKE